MHVEPPVGQLFVTMAALPPSLSQNNVTLLAKCQILATMDQTSEFEEWRHDEPLDTDEGGISAKLDPTSFAESMSNLVKLKQLDRSAVCHISLAQCQVSQFQRSGQRTHNIVSLERNHPRQQTTSRRHWTFLSLPSWSQSPSRLKRSGRSSTSPKVSCEHRHASGWLPFCSKWIWL